MAVSHFAGTFDMEVFKESINISKVLMKRQGTLAKYFLPTYLVLSNGSSKRTNWVNNVRAQVSMLSIDWHILTEDKETK